MNVIGLDPSLTSFGFAGENGIGTWKSKVRGMERLVDLRDRVCRLCCAHDERADVVCIEDYAFSRAGAHSHELGELGGVVRLHLYEHGVPFVAVNPSHLKTFATGRGNAKKEDVLAAAIRRLGYPGSSFDEADALWLRTMGMYAYSQIILALPGKQSATITKIEWPVLDVAA